MYLGKCPICQGKLSIYDSLNIKDVGQRWDYLCSNKKCMINALTWNYFNKKDAITIYHDCMKMIEKNHESCGCKISKSLNKKFDVKKKTPKKVESQKPKKVIKKLSIHYSISGNLNDVECSSRKHAKLCTCKEKEVTCPRCKKMLSKTK